MLLGAALGAFEILEASGVLLGVFACEVAVSFGSALLRGVFFSSAQSAKLPCPRSRELPPARQEPQLTLQCAWVTLTDFVMRVCSTYGL
jgi:hypothetical protein